MPTAKKPEAQIMDVSKPGKSPAEPSARPVIVGHRSLVQDPMVTSTEASKPDKSESEEETKPTSPSSGKKVIVPLGEQAAKPNKADQSAREEPNNASDSAERTASADEETKEQAGAEESTEAVSDAAVVDSVIEQVNTGTKREEELKAAEERKKTEAIEKLITEKKYFVPIGKDSRSSIKGMWVPAVVLLLTLLVIVGAIDAEILKTGFSLPFDFL